MFWKRIAPALMVAAGAAIWPWPVARILGAGALAFWLSRRMGASGIFASVLVGAFSAGTWQVGANFLAMGALAMFLPAWDAALRGESPAWWRLALAAGLCGLWAQGWYVALAIVVSLVHLMRWRAVKPMAIFASAYAAADWAPRVAVGSPVGHGVGLDGALFLMPFYLPLAARLSGTRWVETPMLPYWMVAYALWFAGWRDHHDAVLMAVLFVSMCEAGGRRLERAA